MDLRKSIPDVVPQASMDNSLSVENVKKNWKKDILRDGWKCQETSANTVIMLELLVELITSAVNVKTYNQPRGLRFVDPTERRML
jgi:hypothetical protein